MRAKVKDVPVKVVPKEDHYHHWVIESANGPTSMGVCKYCSAEKEFHNVVPIPEVVKKNTRLFDLPELPDVEVDKDNNS